MSSCWIRAIRWRSRTHWSRRASPTGTGCCITIAARSGCAQSNHYALAADETIRTAAWMFMEGARRIVDKEVGAVQAE